MPDADAARVIAKVRRLMLVSMAVTVIAVGSVFGFIGYRIFKGEGTTAKTADKLPRRLGDPDRHDAGVAARRARDAERGRQRPPA